MKKEFTLITLFISLFLIAFNANAEMHSNQIKACNHAINQSDASAAIKLANTILKSDEMSFGGLLCKGRALALQGKYNEALTMHESATKNANTNFDQIIAHLLTGNLHKRNKKMEAAITSYESSLEACKLDNNQQYTRISHQLIGDIHMQLKQLDNAASSYMAGSKLANNDNERADSYEKLAGTYEKLAQYDSAIEYQVKAVVMQQKAGTLDAYANANLTLGKMFLKAKEYNSAEKTFRKLEKFSIDNGGAYYEAKANLQLAATKVAQNELVAAKSLIAHARSISNKLGAADLANEVDTMEKQLKN